MTLPLVLIVDDNPENLTVIGELLQPRFRVRVANGGPRALRLAAASPQPDLILLDVMMPGTLDGLQVCARVRANPALQGTRVVLLTARGQLQDRDAGQQAGADEYLIKPFSPLQLIETIERLMPSA